MAYNIKDGKLVKSGPQRAPDVVMEEVSAERSETGTPEVYLWVGGERVAYRSHDGTGKFVSLVGDKFHDESGEPERPGDLPIIDCGEVQFIEEPKTRVQ